MRRARRGRLASGALRVGLGLAFLVWQRPEASGAGYGTHSGPMVRQPIGPFLDGNLPSTAVGPFPPVLSQTGAFTDVVTLQPIAALVPFTMNVPLWSDGSLKSRWVALPNDGPPYTPNEQAGFSPDRAWVYPEGTVFVKHFELVINEVTGQRRRLETRFLVREPGSHAQIYGITYKWRDDQLEADLLPDAPLNETYTIVTATGTRDQTYTYPSRSQCEQCHNELAGGPLGPKTAQLNGAFVYPTGHRDNQLRVWNRLGMIYPALDESLIGTYPRLIRMSDTTTPLSTRVRSYLDANCSHCHRGGGAGPVWDGRFSTPLADQKIVGTSEITPGNVTASQMYQRMNRTVSQGGMPPILKNVVHAQAVQTVQDWIGDLCNGGPVFGGLRSIVSRGGCSIDLGWTAAPSPWGSPGTPGCGSPVTYSVYRSATPHFVPSAGNRIAEGLSGTSFTDSFGSTPGTPYYYVVRALNTGNGLEDGNLLDRTTVVRGCTLSPSDGNHSYWKATRRARRLRNR